MENTRHIPLHLKDLGFVKVLKNSKKPFEDGWQNKPNNYENTSKWLKNGGNYGILAGFKSVLTIDIDRKTAKAIEITDNFVSFLPETFKVLTPSGGFHFYYICEDWDGFYNLEWEGEHIGECRYWGQQTVGPNSIHPDFNKPYIVKDDIPLTNIEAKFLQAILYKYLKRPIKAEKSKKRWDGGNNVDISKFTDVLKLDKAGKQYIGSHPVHGSSTGNNFAIDTEKNVWHCFRHGCGGGTLSLIAVMEGIIPCEQAIPGGLKGDLYKQTLKTAKDKYGIEVKKVKFNPNIIADQLMAESRYIYCNQHFFEYSQGVYKVLNNIEVDKKTKQFLDEDHNRNRAEEIRHCIGVEKFIHNDELNKDRTRINLLNGIYNLDTMKLEDHSEEFLSSIQLPIIFDKDASCPMWEKTLSEIFLKKQWKIECLQEFMGYCLKAENTQQATLLNVGGGANGKSLIFKVFRTILGEQNVSSITIDNLNNRHYLAGLFGKLVNLSIESESGGKVNEANIKSIISGDPIMVDEKYEKAFTFEPFCKMIFSMNELPYIDDKTEAFYRRLLIIPYEKQFSIKEQNRNLYKELLPEMSGIFNWMIIGLQRLEERGMFNINKEMTRIINDYKKDNSPIITFIEDNLEEDINSKISKNDLYKKYSLWCKEFGYKPLSDKSVTKEMKNFYKKQIKKRKVREDRDSNSRFWEGVRFNFIGNKEKEERWEQ